MELKDSPRVVNTIVERLELAIAKQFPMASKMVPSEVKLLIKSAIEGGYASGFNHGYIEGKNNGATK